MTATWPETQLQAEALDALSELINIGVGRAAAALSDLIGTRIELTVPVVQFGTACDANIAFGSSEAHPSTIIVQDFNGRLAGRAALIFPQSSGMTLASLLVGSCPRHGDLDVEFAGVLLEVGNILLNGVMGSLSNSMRAGLDYTVPELISAGRNDEMIHSLLTVQDTLYANIQFRTQDRDIEGSIAIVFAMGSVRELLDSALAA